MTSAPTGIAGATGSGTSMAEVLQKATDDPTCRAIGGFVETEDSGMFAYHPTANPEANLSDIADSAKLSANATIVGRYKLEAGDWKRVGELVTASG